MRKIFTVILFSVCFALCLAAGTADTVKLDMQTYIKMVEKKNRNIINAEREVKKAELSYKQAKAGFLPSVFLQSGYKRNLSSQYMYANLGLPGSNGGTSKFKINYDNEFSLYAGVSQNVFSAELNAKVKASEDGKKVTALSVKRAKKSILNSARKLYLAIIVLKERVEVLRDSKDNAYENYVQIKKKYECGQVSKLQLLSAEVRFKEKEPALIEAERNLKTFMNDLKILAAIDLKKTIEIKEKLVMETQSGSDLNLSEVLAKRSDYQSMLSQLDMMRNVSKAAKGAALPKVGAEMSYTYSAISNSFKLENENNMVSAGITISMPLYTGGALKAEKAKADIDVKSTETELFRLRDQIARNCLNLKIKLEELGKRTELFKKTYDTAVKAFEIAEVSADEGLATQLELKDSRNQLDSARLLYLNSIYEYNCCVFDLKVEQGRF